MIEVTAAMAGVGAVPQWLPLPWGLFDRIEVKRT
jgi:hypothetical protein